MEILKAIGLRFLKYVGAVIIAVIVVLVTLFSYFPLQMYLFGRGDSLLFISGPLYIIPVFMTMILLLFLIISFCSKFSAKKFEEWMDDEIQNYNPEEDIEPQNMFQKILFIIIDKSLDLLFFLFDIYDRVKVYYIPVLLIAIYAGMTNYTVLYSDSIKLSTPLKPFGVTYSYDDIVGINVQVDKGKDDYYDPSYEVLLHDGKTINFFGASVMNEGNKGFEEVLIEFDKKMRKQGIPKSVNKDNFEKFAEGLNTEYTGRVEKLFIK